MRCQSSHAIGLWALILGVFAAASHADGPVVRLFPTTVVEDIRQTGAAAEAMENGLSDVIERLDLQRELYAESRCAEAQDDPGCEQIQRQLGATYLEMLNTMSEHLPQMERAVANTRASLEARLRDELGRRTTPTDLQALVLGEAKAPASTARDLALRGRSGLRLSDRFQRYYQLVSTSPNAGQSLSVVAADIYLDMDEAAALLAATQEEIARASLMEQLSQSFGVITPEMEQVVSGVKSILFGDPDAPGGIAAPPVAASQTTYKSPLEF